METIPIFFQKLSIAIVSDISGLCYYLLMIFRMLTMFWLGVMH